MEVGQSWEEGLKTGLCFVKENKKLINHVYNSLHRETIERYLYSVSLDFAGKFIDNVSKSAFPTMTRNLSHHSINTQLSALSLTGLRAV